MSACRGYVGAVQGSFQAFLARTLLSWENVSSPRRCREIRNGYIATARVLLHRNLVIDVLRAICDRT